MVADLESKELWKLSSLYVWERGAGDTPLVWRSKPAGLQNLRKTENLSVSYSESRSGWGEGLAETANKEQWTPGPFLPTHPARKPLPTGRHKALDFMGALSDRGSGSRTGKTCLIYPHHRCDENISELGVGGKNPKHRFPLAPSKHQQSRTDPFRGQHSALTGLRFLWTWMSSQPHGQEQTW